MIEFLDVLTVEIAQRERYTGFFSFLPCGVTFAGLVTEFSSKYSTDNHTMRCLTGNGGTAECDKKGQGTSTGPQSHLRPVVSTTLQDQ